MYDSGPSTWEHVERVRELLDEVLGEVIFRSCKHDRSKFESPEKEVFDEFTPRLKEVVYGSDEYKAMLKAMKPALDHHYAENRHHPEHFTNGIRGMNLIDLLEMLADWKAAGERTTDGNLAKSIESNAGRFRYGHEIRYLLMNTARDMDWLNE